ncbi:hypothetical protein F4604DRAFT_1915023 [Suillus subluteus]|nr:hypothetical protein F4604DRAFT_1915023 [Suillus subluteus]
MHELLREFNIDPRTIEKVDVVCHNLKWEPDAQIEIVASKEEAVQADEDAEEEVRIYSDGSAIDGGVGAAAVLTREGREPKILYFHLGMASQHTVYEAEIPTSVIGIDNQATILATQSFTTNLGHYLMDMFHRTLKQALSKRDEDNLTIRWTPGHVDIEGNELADVEAKKAAGGFSSAPPLLPNCLCKHRRNGPTTIATLPCSKSALKQQRYDQLKKEGQTIMHESPHYPLLKKIDDGVPSNQFQKLVTGLPERQASLLMQLRMGHAPLNKHLHHIKSAETPLCPTCENREDDESDDFTIHYNCLHDTFAAFHNEVTRVPILHKPDAPLCKPPRFSSFTTLGTLGTTSSSNSLQLPIIIQLAIFLNYAGHYSNTISPDDVGQ